MIEHPWRTVLRLLPVGIAVMLAVDLALGSAAEYYNAVHLIQAWAEVLSGGSVAMAPTFIVNQAGLGGAAAMVIGTVLLFVEPLVLLVLVVVPISHLARRFT
jgi:hypothetical protein